MHVANLQSALLEIIRATGPISSPPQLQPVWTAFQRWLATPLPGVVSQVEFEGYLAGGSSGVAAYMGLPPGVSSDFVCCLEFLRSVTDDRNVGVGLYFPVDQEWWDLARAAGWDPDQPFVVERWWPEPGPLGRFVAEVEASPWFQLALRKRAEAVIVFDTASSEDTQLA